MSLIASSLSELSESIHSGKITSREITEAFIAQIEKEDKNLNVFVTKTFDLARKMADASDSRFKEKKLLSPLDGIPITLKDVICTKGIKTTASSLMLKDFVPPYDATVWQLLKDSGVVLLGKVNTDEFTMGSSTENSAFGPTKNPHNPKYVSGGSSGGSAAAISANMCAASIGTDTGGSIRQPAHFCGCTGLKVSYGRVSRWGTIPMASSLDTVGVLAKTPQDCGIVLNVIGKPDDKDGTTIKTENADYISMLDNPIKGLTFGIPEEYYTEGLDPEVKNIIDASKTILESLGAKIEPISLPHTKYGVSTYYIVSASEISANLSCFDGLRFGISPSKKDLESIYTHSRQEGFGAEVKRRIMLGTYALSAGYYDAYYKKAQCVRTLIKEDFTKAFQKVDFLLAPVAPSPAFLIGEKSKDPLSLYLEDILTIPSSLAGIPGITVPVGFNKQKLPIGVQMLSPFGSEEKLLNYAHQLFKATKS